LEIHAQAAELGGNLVERFGGRVIADDVLEGAILLEPAQTFDLVVSLSAVDLPPINVPERLLVLGCCGASFA